MNSTLLHWFKNGLLTLIGFWFSFYAEAQKPAQGPISDKKYLPGEMGYQLIWNDEFEGTLLDTSKWRVRGIGPRAIAYVSEKAVKVEDGLLKLYALNENDTLFGSAVGTQGLFMTKYGWFECRAQVQKSPGGVWSAFWIQSTEIAKGEDPSIFGAEIDIMECFRKLGEDIFSHNVHWAYGPNQQSTRGYQSYLKGMGEGFHTFALEWLPDRYIFYVDGFKFYEITKGISNIEEYLILSMEYPNNHEEIAKSVFPDVFLVDYVRVYQK
ncbi:MAG TPA: glycoside hydrolase family 16 protein, partial [Draconibacterium sp.]|nr:glycoside hydrolase family 16 protein [Draconibacterium sp.]